VELQTEVRTDYPYQAAGRTWMVPELLLTSLPDGSAAISEQEINRIHRAIANEICGSDANLSMAELELLCDVTDTTLADVANALRIHRSTVTRWRKSGEVPKSIISLVLKKWFWHLLFGSSFGPKAVPLDCALDEAKLLPFLKEETIQQRLADSVSRARIEPITYNAPDAAAPRR
jgi:hypothetical protein